MQAGSLVLAVMIGGGLALQTSLIGAISRGRGPVEAVWLSLLGSVMGVALLATGRAVRGERALAAPFDRVGVVAVLALGFGAVVALAARGSAAPYAATGLLALPFLFGAAVLGPRLGIGLYLAAAIAGQLIGGVALDHVGAFGAKARRLDPARAIGVVALLIGVALVRGRGSR